MAAEGVVAIKAGHIELHVRTMNWRMRRMSGGSGRGWSDNDGGKAINNRVYLGGEGGMD